MMDGEYKIPCVPKPLTIGTETPILLVDEKGNLIPLMRDEFLKYYKEAKTEGIFPKSLVFTGDIQRFS
ncbi:MAG: hypothetical protein AB1630_07165 [bacterium]